jgi:hypothetical protein
MDTEHRVIAALLALKDAPDDVLVDQVQAIGASQQPPEYLLHQSVGTLRGLRRMDTICETAM